MIRYLIAAAAGAGATVLGLVGYALWRYCKDGSPIG